MDTNKNLFWNKAMFWGFITALASMLVTTVYYSTDSMESKSQSWVNFAILAIGIIVCTLMYRQTLGEKDEFPYSKALGLGVTTIFFASLILAVFTFVLYKYIDPDLVSKSLSASEQKLLDKGYTEDMVEQQLEMTRKFMTPAVMSIFSIFGNVIIGLVISLITSIFLRKKAADGFEAAMSEIEED